MSRPLIPEFLYSPAVQTKAYWKANRRQVAVLRRRDLLEEFGGPEPVVSSVISAYLDLGLFQISQSKWGRFVDF